MIRIELELTQGYNCVTALHKLRLAQDLAGPQPSFCQLGDRLSTQSRGKGAVVLDMKCMEP